MSQPKRMRVVPLQAAEGFLKGLLSALGALSGR